eukprot:7740496-Pyramimonas_sp.AAC.1
MAEVTRMRGESKCWGSFASNAARIKGPAGMLRIDGVRITQDPEQTSDRVGYPEYQNPIGSRRPASISNQIDLIEEGPAQSRLEARESRRSPRGFRV